MKFLEENFLYMLIAAVSAILILQLGACGIQYRDQDHVRQLKLIETCKHLNKEPIVEQQFGKIIGCR